MAHLWRVGSVAALVASASWLLLETLLSEVDGVDVLVLVVCHISVEWGASFANWLGHLTDGRGMAGVLWTAVGLEIIVGNFSRIFEG